MLFSTSWLQRYVELPDSVDELGEILTRCGLVVEDTRRFRSDTVFDLDIPSNRADAMNHVGVARELAAALRVELQLPATDVAEHEPVAARSATVRIDDFDGCPRYAARVVRDVTIGPSPQWLADRLTAIGLRPLNNVADITNFVLWELGHPLHAFDLDKLTDATIVVRRAATGERLTTLDGEDRALVEDDVIIADATRPVALAGIMGGADSAITEASTNVLLEGAWFDPAAVRRTANRLNLHTDASHRFERSPAHDGMLAALDRAASLVAELTGGSVAIGTLDVVGSLPSPVAAVLRLERLSGLLGVEIPAADAGEILRRLGFGVEPDDTGLRVAVPSFRPDVCREEDLVEEVARHYGYDRLPATLPAIAGGDKAGTPEVLGERRLKASFAAAGFREAMSSSLSSADEQAWFLDSSQETLRLANPISENLGVLRAHLVPGLLTAAAHNMNRGQTDLRLFEVGRRFLGPIGPDGAAERWGLGLLACGRRSAPGWDVAPLPFDLFDMKGAIETVTDRMGWPQWEWASGEHPGLSPETTAVLSVGRESGEAHAARSWVGSVSADVAAAFGLPGDVWVAELDVDALLPETPPTPRHRPLSRFPGGDRDLAIVLPIEVSYSLVQATVRATAGADALPLADLVLIEVYRGSEIPAGSRGMTLRFTYRADDRTLTADEIEGAHRVLATALQEQLEAIPR